MLRRALHDEHDQFFELSENTSSNVLVVRCNPGRILGPVA